MNFLTHFYLLFLESAPWLLFGLLMAGILKTFIPMTWMNKQLGGHNIQTTIKAAFIGAPLPLCSCGVIPAAIGLRRAGASKSATTSFLISTPETGIDSVSVSYVLLGPFLTIVRPIAAIFSAISAGLLVGRDDIKHTEEKEETVKSCCSSNSTAAKDTDAGRPIRTTCGSKSQTSQNQSIWRKIQQGLTFSATNLIDDITLWLLTGLGFAALVQAYLPEGFLTQWGNGILAMSVMVVISIPMYICATASTPIGAGLLMAGVSPGAVLVFMLAGPATNIATLGVVWKELGRKALISYLIGVIGGAIISGYLVNIIVMQLSINVTPQMGPEHTLLPTWISLTCGLLLTILMLFSIGKSLKKIITPRQQA